MLEKTYKGVLFLASLLGFFSVLVIGAQEGIGAEQLSLVGDGKQISIQVEIADTKEKRRVGLMHRTSLPPLTGMLFDFKRIQSVGMWMRNTLIPLDMIFADSKGQIVYIKEQAQPGDLSIVSPNSFVLAVLEMAGGFVRQYDVKVGDRLIHPLFND